MKQVKEKDTVVVTYIGTLDNETVFETVKETKPKTIDLSDENTPLPFKLILPGMKVGETRVVKMTAEEGEFGIRRSDLLHQIPKTQFTNKIEPKVGLVLSMNVERDGVNHQVPATIVEVANELITIDYNHPLAGHPLNYEVTVVDIIKAE
jgi:FKBP-type peptidyl-prolyl cis-trans isomerase 2